MSTQVRDLNNAQRQEICQVVHDWKKVVAMVPSYRYPNIKRFTDADIKCLDTAYPNGQMLGFLSEWESMGISRRPHLKDLLKLLLEADELAAASIIAEKYLNEEPITEANKATKIDELKNVFIKDYKDEEITQNDTKLEQNWDSLMDVSIDAIDDHSAILDPNYPLAREHGFAVHEIPFDYLVGITNRFRNVLGQGGYGVVFFGKSHSRGIKVAVKRLMTESAGVDSVEATKRINYEVSELPKMRHPNIMLPVAVCRESPEKLCLVYPYMENGNLKERLAEKSMNFEQKMKIILGIARGLNKMHTTLDDDKKSYVHRDVKPSNILLDRDFNPKVADHDLLRKGTSGDGMTTVITRTENIAGTNMYMPPEYMNSGDVNAKFDVWSYGVVLLEILTNRPVTWIDPEDPDIRQDLISHFKGESEIFEEFPKTREKMDACLKSEFFDRSRVRDYCEPQFHPHQDHCQILFEICTGSLIEQVKERFSMEEILKKLSAIMN